MSLILFRLVHYPHNPHLLDMCDELGILLWQETLGWGLSESTLTNPDIQKDLLYVREFLRAGVSVNFIGTR